MPHPEWISLSAIGKADPDFLLDRENIVSDERKKKRLESLDELSKLDQELGFYDISGKNDSKK